MGDCQEKDHMKEERYPQRKQLGSMIEITVGGSWNNMGRQYGALLKNEILYNLEYAKRRATKESDEFLLPFGLPLGIDFIDEFLLGVAESVGISLADLVRLNGIEVAYADELMKEFGPASAGKCAGLAIFGRKTRDGRVIYGRNYDWLPSFSELPMVLAHFIPDDGMQALAMINYAGCLYMVTGMNQSGLFLELNSGCFATAAQNNEVPQNAWYLWPILGRAKNVADAEQMLKSCKARNVYIIGIADAAHTLSYEWDVNAPMTVLPDDGDCCLAMTNHFARPEWNNLPGAADGGACSSICRRNALLHLADQIPDGSGDLEDMKRIFNATVDAGGAKWAGTLYQVIADPVNETMYVRHAHDREWIPFCLEED